MHREMKLQIVIVNLSSSSPWETIRSTKLIGSSEIEPISESKPTQTKRPLSVDVMIELFWSFGFS